MHYPHLEDDDDAAVAVPKRMQQRSFWKDHCARKSTYNVHTGQVNLPGLTKRSRIISMKVPLVYHTEHDGIDYTILDWLREVKRWCVICEVKAFRQGPLIAMAVDGVSTKYTQWIDDDILIYGEPQDWGDGQGVVHRTGVELNFKLVVSLNPPDTQAIQMQAVKAWHSFSRKPNKTSRALINRMKVVVFECEERGSYPLLPIA